MRPSRFVVGAALAATVACGKAEDKAGGPAPAASPGAPTAAVPAPSAGATAEPGAEIGRCKIEVTGDLTASATPVRHSVTDGKVGIGTDYWMSDDEIESALRVMAGIGSDKDVDRDAVAAEGMKKDPRMFLFLMNCGDENVHLSVLPGNESRYADLPRAPKKYAITSDAKAGEVSVMLTVGDGHFGVKGPGTFEITRFDSSRIEGTFAFDAEERFGKKRSVKVAGSFQYDCVGSKSCGK